MQNPNNQVANKIELARTFETITLHGETVRTSKVGPYGAKPEQKISNELLKKQIFP